MKKVICFGAGGSGKRLFESISEKYNITCFADNDSRKWGSNICGVPCKPIKECLLQEWDYIIITSLPGLGSIKQQLLEEGIEESKIITSYVLFELEARKEFLKSFAFFDNTFDAEAAVAEVGVFQGDFASEINKCFPTRNLHLFDTFSGFVKRDIDLEKDSNAKTGDYNNTSVEMVLGKMSHSELVTIHKGYFPATTAELKPELKFVFVNLDVDLYEPTYQGLLFFENRMLSGGVILVHDYFSNDFDGPKRAVDKFIQERDKKYVRVPIGDKISIMICGF